MVKLTIDNRKIEVEEGTTLLEAADSIGISIPTLCYHESLSPFGACRLCTVEIITDGASKLTSACSYHVEKGLVVNTHSEKVLEARKLAMELLLAKWPHAETIQSLAREMGIEKPSFTVKEEQCILCGLCVRTCHEIVEADAITFIDRGLGREMKEPHIEASSAKCIGCGSCVYICPTNYIKMEEVKDTRIIWDRVFKMKRCKACGNFFAPEAQLNYIIKKLNLPQDFFDTCPNCR